MFPAASSAMASLRGALRLVGFELPYSRLRLAKPVAPSGRPTLPATLNASPSPSWKVPVSNSRVPPELASLSWKFITPAMASEPYWAAAPSRSTSTCRRAMAGMAEMSGPCEPYATPLPPCQSMIDERWRRLPFTSTSVWSGARLRSIAGRTTVDASLIGCVLTANEGITVRSCSGRLATPWLVMSAADRTSTGTGDSATVRGRGPRADDDSLLGEPVEQNLQLLGRQPERPDLVDRHAEGAAERVVFLLRQVFLGPCRQRAGEGYERGGSELHDQRCR